MELYEGKRVYWDEDNQVKTGVVCGYAAEQPVMGRLMLVNTGIIISDEYPFSVRVVPEGMLREKR